MEKLGHIFLSQAEQLRQETFGGKEADLYSNLYARF